MKKQSCQIYRLVNSCKNKTKETVKLFIVNLSSSFSFISFVMWDLKKICNRCSSGPRSFYLLCSQMEKGLQECVLTKNQQIMGLCNSGSWCWPKSNSPPFSVTNLVIRPQLCKLYSVPSESKCPGIAESWTNRLRPELILKRNDVRRGMRTLQLQRTTWGIAVFTWRAMSYRTDRRSMRSEGVGRALKKNGLEN